MLARISSGIAVYNLTKIGHSYSPLLWMVSILFFYQPMRSLHLFYYFPSFPVDPSPLSPLSYKLQALSTSGDVAIENLETIILLPVEARDTVILHGGKLLLQALLPFMMKTQHNASTERWRSQKQVNSAAERNKEPIFQVLKKFVTSYIDSSNKQNKTFHCLEISSGSGQHVAHFAPHFPSVMWQPSEVDMTDFGSISAYIQDAGVTNIQQPIYIDVSEDYTKWGGGGVIGKQSMDFMLNINLMHISPLKCTNGLFTNAGHVLKSGGLLITYGPYAFHGKISPESNIRFDSMLRSQNPEWGLRDIDYLTSLAYASGLHLVEVIAMPANNHCLIWRKE